MNDPRVQAALAAVGPALDAYMAGELEVEDDGKVVPPKPRTPLFLPDDDDEGETEVGEFRLASSLKPRLSFRWFPLDELDSDPYEVSPLADCHVSGSEQEPEDLPRPVRNPRGAIRRIDSPTLPSVEPSPSPSSAIPKLKIRIPAERIRRLRSGGSTTESPDAAEEVSRVCLRSPGLSKFEL